MYYAMIFHKDVYNPQMSSVRPARVAPYKTMTAAIRAVERVGHGYIKQLGIGKPVWTNVKGLR